MPYWGCTECHHEWEGGRTEETCDWCEAPGKVLEEKTPFEKMLDDWSGDGASLFNWFGSPKQGVENT